MSTEGKREFELRFKGLTDKPLVVAKNDGYLKYPNEIVRVIEHSAYQKAVDALKEIGGQLSESGKYAREILEELGEI